MSSTTAVPPAEPEAQATIGPIGRIIGVLFSPKSTFEDIARKPSWVAPIVLLTLIGLSMNVLLAIKVDWRSFAKEQLISSSRWQQTPADQRDLEMKSQQKVSQLFSFISDAL